MKFYDRMPGFLRRQLHGRQVLQRILSNSAWLVGDQLFRMVAALLTGVWTARYLGPTRYGWLSFATAAVGIVTSFTSLGINAVVVRELVRIPQERAALIGTAFCIRISTAFLSLLVCIGIAVFRASPADSVRVLIVILAIGMVCQSFDIIDLIFQARGEPRVSAWVRMSGSTIISVVKVILIIRRAPIEAFAAASTVEIALNSAFWLFANQRRDLSIWRWHCSRALLARLLRESWPLALSGLAIYAQAYADQLVIGSMLGPNELGQYAAAMRFISVFGFIPVVVSTVASPEITRARQEDEKLYRQRLYGLYRVMFVLFLLVALPLIALGAPVTRLLYGMSFDRAASLIPWLAFRLFFTNFGVARSIFLTNEGMFRFSLGTAIVGGLTNIGLNLLLVPRMGSSGAILSSIVSFAVSFFALEMLDPRARKNVLLMLRATTLARKPPMLS